MFDLSGRLIGAGVFMLALNIFTSFSILSCEIQQRKNYLSAIEVNYILNLVRLIHPRENLDLLRLVQNCAVPIFVDYLK